MTTFILSSNIALVSGTYLDVPRINFIGRLRVDANTINNMRCNYKTQNIFEDTKLNPNSNINGSNECSLLDSKITGIVFANGTLSTADGLLVGADIFDNDVEPFAKMIDLDVDVQGKSVIYGMKVGVRLANGTIAFKGDYIPNVVSQDFWFRVKCYGPTHSGIYPFDASFALGAQATTRITNITWNHDLTGSPFLQELKSYSESQNGDLSMRLSFYFYTRSYEPFLKKNFTLAHIIGSIGSAKNGESLNFGGERILSPSHFSPPNKVRTDIKTDSCFEQRLETFPPWLFKAPFKIDYTTKIVTVDLSNALPVDMYGSLKDIGPIHLGIFVTITSQYPEFCVSPITLEPIPYLEDYWLQSTSGIVTYSFNDYQLDNIKTSKLIIFQEISEQDDSNDLGVPFCGEVFPSFKHTHLAQVLIEESRYYIRPLDAYVDRMEYGETRNITLLATEYGVPVSGIAIKLKRSNNDALPSNGLVPEEWVVETDKNGHAIFNMHANEPIPYPRRYTEPPCLGTNDSSLPIDGQIYLFKYCIESECPPNMKHLFVSELTFLVFSTINYSEPYTWVDHVEPIFSQYYHLNRAMALVLNLSDYNSVTKPSNVQLIKSAMSQEFNNPNFMPVTRDLSPTKTKMILNWLDNPIYSTIEKHSVISSNNHLSQTDCKFNKPINKSPPIFPRCQLNSIPINSHPADTDPYFKTFVHSNQSLSLPLSDHSDVLVCTLENIRSQLQIGIETKLHSIPLYLTALYSVIDGCNTAFYHLFLTTALKEMTRLYNTALLLQMLDGKPNLSTINVLPVFPRNGFPGNILNDLEVNLEKASLQQLYELFLVMNLPQHHGSHIGMDSLYSDIIKCFQIANVSRIVDDVLAMNDDKNMKNCKPIHNTTTAIDLVNDIITDNKNMQLHDVLFYKIEELVCERKLEYIDENTYAYSGDTLSFNNEGVWSMMSNPSWNNIEHNTNCYTRARVFNQVYRKLMSKIEQSFVSETDMYFEAIQLMKSLHVHFKKVLWTERDSGNEQCGPVFN